MAREQGGAREAVLHRLLERGVPPSFPLRPGARSPRQGGGVRQRPHRSRQAGAVDRPDAVFARRPRRDHGLSVRQAPEVGEGGGVRDVQLRHGAARLGRRAQRRASVGEAGASPVPARRGALQFPGSARLQGEISPHLGAALHGLPRILGMAAGGRAGVRADRGRLALVPAARKGDLVIALALVAAALVAAPPAVGERTLRLPIVGEATVYVPPDPTDRAILFLSGDGGWSKGVLDMARRASADASAVVAGLSYPRLRDAARSSRGPCWYPAGDLEVIGQAMEKQLQFPEYTRPFLIGYSSGASLVYAALAASSESFSGGMSLGFCPDLEGVPPLCAHDAFRPKYDATKKRAVLPPVDEIAGHWEVLQGA